MAKFDILYPFVKAVVDIFDRHKGPTFVPSSMVLLDLVEWNQTSSSSTACSYSQRASRSCGPDWQRSHRSATGLLASAAEIAADSKFLGFHAVSLFFFLRNFFLAYLSF